MDLSIFSDVTGRKTLLFTVPMYKTRQGVEWAHGAEYVATGDFVVNNLYGLKPCASDFLRDLTSNFPKHRRND